MNNNKKRQKILDRYKLNNNAVDGSSSSSSSTILQSSGNLACEKPVAVINEVLSEDVACTHFFDLEDLDRCTFSFSSNSPHAFTDNRLFEKVEELACEVDADVAVPLVRALLLDLGWYLLRTQFFDD